MNEIENIQEKMLATKKYQLNWKYKIINISIDVLTGFTHRDRDFSCKELLKELKNMPEIDECELNLVPDDLPF